MPHESHTFVSISVPKFVLTKLNLIRGKRDFCREPQYMTIYKALQFYEENHNGNERDRGTVNESNP